MSWNFLSGFLPIWFQEGEVFATSFDLISSQTPVLTSLLARSSCTHAWSDAKASGCLQANFCAVLCTLVPVL